MSKALLAGLFAFAFAGLTLGCTPEVPAHPTYTNDVKAILDAHCIRCHGQNDMLTPMLVHGTVQPPIICYLQQYDDAGDCTAATSTNCQHGAGYCGSGPVGSSLITTYINAAEGSLQHMPPLPSLPLSDWEKQVLTNWAAPMPAR